MISKDKFDEVLNNYKNLKSLLEKNCDLEVNYADYEFKNMKDSEFLWVGESPYSDGNKVASQAFDVKGGVLKGAGKNLNEMAKFWLRLDDKLKNEYSDILDNTETIFDASQKLKINLINAYPIIVEKEEWTDDDSEKLKSLLSENFALGVKKENQWLIDLKNGWLSTLLHKYKPENVYSFGIKAYERVNVGQKLLHPALRNVDFEVLSQDYLVSDSLFRKVFKM
ncbi:hypothetical protein [Weissella cibaria]|uniref:hypothetical protein n=1 Tax=Weissella cibaria TaxID=137591 RepID=UPI00106E0B9C|nr:hypothetical protein [Weissella cibaria]MBZ5941951.1 hypothetical protein [Weissella cibaria]MCB5826094.1 hypothetical protein [Weissella cibaria]MCB5857653.1 hypothetical protein [Weissella cibaria]MCB5859879.1 hypothetical protein [Weissella cibaria]MCB5862171.1 hypothetical protein [Weissella cibaria]